MQLPYIPADVPFSGDQKAWLAGFLAGLNTRINMAPPAPGLPAVGPAAAGAAVQSGPVAVQIVYGTQTGTAEFLADEAANAARAKGFLPLVCGLDELEISTLAAVRRLLVITSTYGEGDMPDNAELFWQALAAPSAPPLPGLFFSVLALGDSSYDGFCQAGKNIDARLAELGATRVLDRTDCDLDFEEPAASWTSAALDALTGVDADVVPTGDTPQSTPTASAAAPAAATAARKSEWGRKNPYRATILANNVLSGPGSDKEVRHVVLSLGDSGITYRPGDGVSIAPINDPALVAALIDRLGVPGDTIIADRKGQTTLADALTHRFEISAPSKYLVDYIAQRSGDEELTHLSSTGDREALDAWLWGKDVLDLLDVDPTLPITAEELLAELRPLQPRVYSISFESARPRRHGAHHHGDRALPLRRAHAWRCLLDIPRRPRGRGKRCGSVHLDQQLVPPARRRRHRRHHDRTGHRDRAVPVVLARARRARGVGPQLAVLRRTTPRERLQLRRRARPAEFRRRAHPPGPRVLAGSGPEDLRAGPNA